VPIEKTQMEIERLVKAAGAKNFYRGSTDAKASIGFHLGDRMILFELLLPAKDEIKVKRRGYLSRASDEQVNQLHRSKWRALFLCIKAKLVSVEAKIETVDEAFLAHVVVPTDEGRSARFAEMAIKHIANAYKTGGAPQLPSGPTVPHE
jgi:hypothetical protein